MPIKVIVNGASGRMGQQSCQAIDQAKHLQLVAKCDHQDDLGSAIVQHQAQVVVDFTTPDSVYDNTLLILQAGAHPVIGTSGLNQIQIQTLADECGKLQRGALIVPNFSMSAVLMMHFSAIAARFFPQAEIVEIHHPGKLDAPSGTAIKTAEMIAEHLHPEENPAAKETLPGARGANLHNIPIHSLRLPGHVAHQMVVFGGQGESLTIRQDSNDRSCFMPGVILACEKVVGLRHLVYGLEHILGL
jgi:4-hydroxy-tetrahydrodipicolinate reductase